MTEYEKIRAFENDVLDQHYKGYSFYQYSDDIVIPYLLQVYGDIERYRDYLIHNGHNETNLSIYLINMLHGLGHCIRWITNKDCLGVEDASESTIQQIHKMAADFLNWGIGYHMIAQEFVTWSRNIKKAILDDEKKIITFVNPENFDYSKIYSSQLLYANRMALIYDSYPHEEMEKEFSQWIKEIDLKKPPIFTHIKWHRARDSNSYPLLYLKMQDILFPELDETTDFGGYNLKQLRQFYALVFLTFYFITWVEKVLDSHAGEGNLSFGSNSFELNQKQFEKRVSNITGFDTNVASAIITDLTFNPASFHTSVTIQPFIRSSSGTYHILPNLFVLVEPSRMFLGALNKGNKKKIYDTLINKIEKVNLNSIYNTVKGIKNIICFLEKLIKNNGQQIYPDLILINPSERFLLVADYKHFIGPITASEVDYKMKELEKGITQVKRYIEYLTMISKISSINIQGFSILGLIITHKPLPVPFPKENIIPIIDMETFSEVVKRTIQYGQSIQELARKLQTYFMKAPETRYEYFDSEISVGGWTIRRTQQKIIDI